MEVYGAARSRRLMVDVSPISAACSDAVRVLDEALGFRVCGAVVSGAAMPGFRGIRGGESPYELTRRAVVAPMMSAIGYGEPAYTVAGEIRFDGTVLATVPLNRPVGRSISEALAFLRGHPDGRGIATNGFEWVLMDRGRRGPRVRLAVDMRPYYVEALDRSRFRAAVPADTSAAALFVEAFGRAGS